MSLLHDLEEVATFHNEPAARVIIAKWMEGILEGVAAASEDCAARCTDPRVAQLHLNYAAWVRVSGASIVRALEGG